jgi:futalosine hydrolase
MAATSRRSKLLLLVPTELEARLLFGRKEGARASATPRPIAIGGRRVLLVRTGFGLAAAGATAGCVLARVAPRTALLVGCAGTFDPKALAVGAALVATSVMCDGIGAGEGTNFTTIGRVDALALRTGGLRALAHGESLSVAAASSSPAMAAARRSRRPSARIEEMEGYAVALAARATKVPLTMIRGVCNVVGDRDKRRWRIEEALAPVRAALEAWVG